MQYKVLGYEMAWQDKKKERSQISKFYMYHKFSDLIKKDHSVGKIIGTSVL